MLFGILSTLLFCTLFSLGSGIAHCPATSCPKNCSTHYDIEYDSNMCPVCVCLKTKCPPLPACINTSECTKGFKRIDGCITPSCDCNSLVCEELKDCFAKRCPHGYATDGPKDSCPKCSCARGGSVGSVACNLPPCALRPNCPLGQELEKKANGCPTCKCVPKKPCKQLSCNPDRCYFGSIDYDGCPSCDCRPLPITCAPLKCRRIDCPLGFANDRDGCPTCQCYTGNAGKAGHPGNAGNAV